MKLKELAAQHPITITATATEGQALLAIVARETGLSRQEAAALVRRGGVWHNRRRVLDPAWQPPEGARLALHTPPGGEYRTVTIGEEHLLYEDEWLVALNKQPGWFAVPTPWDLEGNVEAALQRLYAARSSAEPPLHLAHRLDRDTSGVLLVSKAPEMNGALQKLFVEGGIGKRYLALAAGTIEPTLFEMRTGHGRGVSGLFRVYDEQTIGQQIGPQQRAIKAAHTGFTVLERLAEATLVEARPYTGRTHQIRLHLAARGHPVVGDQRYGGPCKIGGLSLEHHLLHAYELALTHPATGKPLFLRAALPPLFATALERLRDGPALDSNSAAPYNSCA